jgi:hypothetical protein
MESNALKAVYQSNNGARLSLYGAAVGKNNYIKLLGLKRLQNRCIVYIFSIDLVFRITFSMNKKCAVYYDYHLQL